MGVSPSPSLNGEDHRKRCVAVAGLPRALAAVQAPSGGSPVMGKASTGVAGLEEPLVVVGSAQGGASSRTMRQRQGNEGRVLSLAVKNLKQKRHYIEGFLFEDLPYELDSISKPFSSIGSLILLRSFSWG
jgi:hypothetical protein